MYLMEILYNCFVRLYTNQTTLKWVIYLKGNRCSCSQYYVKGVRNKVLEVEGNLHLSQGMGFL